MKIRFTYEVPEICLTTDVEVPDDIEGPDELNEYLLDQAPIQKVYASEWDYA